MGAMNARVSLIDRMERFHRRYDLLLTPTLPVAAFGAGRLVPAGWPKRGSCLSVRDRPSRLAKARGCGGTQEADP